MRKVILILSLSLFFTCSEGIPKEIEGIWLITEIEYKGQKVYPKTVYEGIHGEIIFEGYENLETIDFKDNSILYLPGFHSKKLGANFSKSENQIIFKSSDADQKVSKELDSTKLVFLHQFIIELGQQEGELILKSDATKMHIISRKVIMEKAVDKVFNSF